MEKVLTTCPYCGTGCTLYLHVQDGVIHQATPNEENSVNKNSLCAKGRFGMEYVHHKDRLTTPLIRNSEGGLEPASWDAAYDRIISAFSGYRDSFGADSIAGFSSARCTNEENYLMQKFMRAAIGTNNVDHCARL